MTYPSIQILGVPGLPEIAAGDDLPLIVLKSCEAADIVLASGDVLVFTQKIVSKAEGRVVSLSSIEPSHLAEAFAANADKDARITEVVLREAKRIVRMDQGILIAETEQGLVCAQAGVDASNVAEKDEVCLLPKNPDKSATQLRHALEDATGKILAVIISDTFGRPWREGVTNVAIGINGMSPLQDYRGQIDPQGRELTSTVIAIADELASAAELVMRKLDRIPVAVIRGLNIQTETGNATELIRSKEKDLFR